MKNIKRRRLVELSLLFLIVGFLVLFSPLVGKAQTASNECYQWIEVLESQTEYQYNFRTKMYEPTPVLKRVRRLVYVCASTGTKTNSATSRGGDSTYPNVVRNTEGKLNPAKGYQWVNPDDPEDFRVKPKPGLIESEPGKLRLANGYRWVNPNDPDDFGVELLPEAIAIKHLHWKGIRILPDEVLEVEKGAFRPAKGYRWVNPKDPNDAQVERIP